MNSPIKIGHYEPWMSNQVAVLFEHEYGMKASDFEDFMKRLYDHPMQQNKCIRLVALEGDKVIGFQSFFFWPYCRDSYEFNTFQSGNSLIHPDYRGKGLFGKMLRFPFGENSTIDADFFIGFPVQASYGSFIKNDWKNVLNLQWYLKLLNPVAFLRSADLGAPFTQTFVPVASNTPPFRLSQRADFMKWKQGLKNVPSDYFYYTVTESSWSITFELKVQVRRKIIREAIVGKIYFSENAEPHLVPALKKLVKALRRSGKVSICSIAINESLRSPDYRAALNTCGFKRIDKHIYFIVKPLNKPDLIGDATLWDIGRADIDTW